MEYIHLSMWGGRTVGTAHPCRLWTREGRRDEGKETRERKEGKKRGKKGRGCCCRTSQRTRKSMNKHFAHTTCYVPNVQRRERTGRVCRVQGTQGRRQGLNVDQVILLTALTIRRVIILCTLAITLIRLLLLPLPLVILVEDLCRDTIEEVLRVDA